MGLMVMKSISWILLLFVCLVCIWIGGCEKLTQEQRVEKLIKRLGHKKVEVRGSAAGALGQIGSEDAVSALIQTLQDPNEDVRINAVQALENIDTPDALKAVKDFESRQ